MLASGTFHLIMGAVWLVGGIAILVTDPPGMRLTRLGLDVSMGWVGLFFAAYDGMRWWSLRSAYQRRRAAEELERRRPERRPAEPPAELNPDFVFDEPPPPEKPV
jgi:hypothetical protein